MKKVLYFASIILALCVIYSCSNNSEMLTGIETIEPTCNKTLADLEAYNENMLETTYTRSKDPKNNKPQITKEDVKDAINIVLADASGAVEGFGAAQTLIAMCSVATGGTGALVASSIVASVNAAKASYDVYNKTTQNNQNLGNPNAKKPDPDRRNVSQDFSATDSTFLQISKEVYMNNAEIKERHYDYNSVSSELMLPESLDYLKDVGESHNALVSAVMECENSENLSLEDFKGMIPPVNLTTKQLDDLFNNVEFKRTYAELSHKAMACTTEDGFDIDKFMSLNNDIPYNVQAALRSYSNLFGSYPTSINDVVEIANGYINIIEQNNEFTESEKQMIFSALTISLYSSDLWGVFLEQ